jgi:hypothetical protein
MRSFGLLGLLFRAGALSLALLGAACHQDPIFAIISREVKPREPRIKGVPTKMAIFDNKVYVGASSLHRYTGSGWDKGPQPPGKIYDLAATSSHLYALTGPDPMRLYRLGTGSASWAEVGFDTNGDGGFPRLQAIYGEVDNEGKPISNILFVGTSSTTPDKEGVTSFAIFYTDGATSGGNLIPVKLGTALLTGAAWDGANHYVSTNGRGVYKDASPTALSLISSGSERVSGLINIGSSTILALCYNGDILRVSSSPLAKLNTNNISFTLRGPAAVWKDSGGTATLLLTAVQNSDRTYGYREIRLSTLTGGGGTIELRSPGNGSPTTVADPHQFIDTVEPKPLNSILQVPASIDPGMVLLLSVQGTGTADNSTDGGLWSYRSRDGILQWNAED